MLNNIKINNINNTKIIIIVYANIIVSKADSNVFTKIIATNKKRATCKKTKQSRLAKD